MTGERVITLLPKSHRLTRDRDFRAVYAQRRSYAMPGLVLCLRRTDLGTTRIGFVAGKKVGNSVVRNRVKRRLREACRMVVGEMCPGCDAVLVARAALRHVGVADLEDLVRTVGRRAGLLPKEAPPAGVGPPSAREGGTECDACASA